MITCPSAFFPQTGSAHWEPLLRARAIETQSYVLAAAQIGEHYAADGSRPARSSYGHACIVDPWGKVVAQCEEDQDFASADIDLSYLEKVRTEMPVMQQRRHDVYAQV